MRTATRGSKSKARRRERAKEVDAARAQRTAKQQLAKLDREGWTAKRERARLEEQQG